MGPARPTCWGHNIEKTQQQWGHTFNQEKALVLYILVNLSFVNNHDVLCTLVIFIFQYFVMNTKIIFGDSD